MEGSLGKKSTWIYLDISLLFFHVVSKLVQALVITYDEDFQALAVEGDVLLPKPFLDPTPPTAQPRLGPLVLSRVWQTEKTSPEASDLHLMTPSKTRSRNSFWTEVAFLVSAYLHSLKKSREPDFLICPRI
jgi:hypothetical protein